MTKLEKSSLVEEEQVPTMDNTTGTDITSPKPNKKRVKDGGADAKNGEEEEECDVEAWDTLSKSFKQVQSVLDRNRDLIQQVNANHQSKIPDNLVKNVSLIREINGNISKVEYNFVDALMKSSFMFLNSQMITFAAATSTARYTFFPYDDFVDDNMDVELGLGELSNCHQQLVLQADRDDVFKVAYDED
ncbi:hypothetical protein POTOM_001954 [Populus tomentosa]|uniref:Protein EARLY FLOWERING 4 domain-containing protein n=1 Tax=Populus tomentosa TaxID=118781 RepID=A0A8X8DIX8_POPTO|nr:hypothetical protein POTOM_001954 [Populus tomentosa]